MEKTAIHRGVMPHVCSVGKDLYKCIEDYNAPGNAQKFEANAAAVSYNAPTYVAQMLAGRMPARRSDAKVLDAASGPGQVGIELRKVGFNNVHAHDGSIVMLEECRRKNVYTQYICCLIEENSQLPVEDNTYDAVTTSGAILENHLPPSSQAEFVRITKPGGYIIISYSTDILTKDYGKAWVRASRELTKQKAWALYGRLVIPNYYHNVEGVVEMYQKLPKDAAGRD